MCRRFIGLFLASLYSASGTLPITLLLGGIFIQKNSQSAMAQEIPEKCALPTDYINQSVDTYQSPRQPTPVVPEILRAFQRPSSPQARSVIEPDVIPVDVSFFKETSQNRIERYRLGPGDRLFIDVLVNGQRSIELSVPDTTISPEGTIALPLVGALQVENLFIADVEQQIRSRLDQFVKNPGVTVSLINQRPVQVTVTGQVARPGFYPLQAPQLVVALSSAGGTTADANLRVVQLRRTLPNGTTVATEVDLLTPLLQGLTPPDLRLEDDDIILVPAQEVLVSQGPERDIIETYSLAANPTPVEITVVGEVSQPGYYALPAGTGRVSTALIAAGGSTLTADLREIIICRPTVDGRVIQETVDLYTPLKEATAIPDVSLANGDSVIVPKLSTADLARYDRDLVAKSTLVNQQITVRVLSNAAGAIGAVALPNGSRFVDVLSNVPLQLAKLKEITLIRFDPDLGRAVTYKLNGREALEGDPENNPLLQNNDVVVIDRNLVTQVAYVLNTFTQPFRDILGFLLFFQQISDAAEALFEPTNEDNNNNNNNNNNN
jgi:polysaccharide export outer membrane protein